MGIVKNKYRKLKVQICANTIRDRRLRYYLNRLLAAGWDMHDEIELLIESGGSHTRWKHIVDQMADAGLLSERWTP